LSYSQDRISSQNHLDRIAIHITACLRINCASFIELGITISFQTLIGIYSGFYANWMALILGYLAFAFVVRYLKSPSNFSIVAIALLLTGALLAHLYTWSIIIVIAFVFLIVLHVLRYYPKKCFLLLYLILSSTIAVDVLKSSLTGAPSIEEELLTLEMNL
jgi:hypothetical protein